MADTDGPTEGSEPQAGSAAPGDADASAQFLTNTWKRVKEHKILQWGLGYFGAALALAHGAELLGHTFHWPEIVQRLILGMLIVGLPLALTLAWYHGHKGLKGVSQGELTIASILVVIGAGLLIALVRAPSEPTAAEPAAAKPQAALAAPAKSSSTAAPRTSIAVMPFANLTGDANKEYLGDGMAEELINTLSKIPGLRIPTRTSTFSYKNRGVDSKQIAEDLQVGTLLEGSVRSAGTILRISVQLSDPQSDSILWSHDYDKNFTDLFKLQDELAKDIVQALQINLKGASAASVVQAPPTHDIEAYRLYLQARQIAQVPTEQRLHESLNLLEQAVARDPNFARAYSALALNRITLRDLGYQQPNAIEDAERDAARALALDPHQASAQAILAVVYAIRGDWLKSETGFRAAMAQEPSEAEIIGEYCLYVLVPTGHLRQAIEEIGRARRLAPVDVYAVGLSMALNAMAGRDSEALRFADLGIALGWTSDARPLQVLYAYLAERKGHYAEAADHILTMVPASLRADGADEVIRAVYAALGDPARKLAAAKALQGLLRKVDADDPGTYLWLEAPRLFTELDNLDLAFKFANQHYDQFARAGGSAWAGLWVGPMRPFRRDPRFQQYAARLKQMDYWKQYGPPDDCDLKDGKLLCH